MDKINTPYNYKSLKTIFPTVFNSWKLSVILGMKFDLLLQHRSVAVSFLQTVVSQVLERRVKLVGKELGSRRQPRRVANAVHTNAAHVLAFALAVIVMTDPTFGANNRMRSVLVG